MPEILKSLLQAARNPHAVPLCPVLSRIADPSKCGSPGFFQGHSSRNILFDFHFDMRRDLVSELIGQPVRSKQVPDSLGQGHDPPPEAAEGSAGPRPGTSISVDGILIYGPQPVSEPLLLPP